MSIHFKTIYLEQNQGHGNARRISLQNCSNDLVALMDADDISMHNRFEKQLAVFHAHPEVDIVGGQITEFIDKPENIVGRRVVPEHDDDIEKFMKKRCPMNQVSVMFKKESIERAGGYQDWFCEEDYYLWIRLALINGIFANVPDDIVNVRIGDAMSARRGGLKYFKSEAKLQQYMLKKHMIGYSQYMYNVLLRFAGEVLLPNRLRTLMFKYMREEYNSDKKCMKSDSSVHEAVKHPEYSLFSVAMCVYGGDNPDWFDTAFLSIVDQTMQPNEIVLVVDGPIPDKVTLVIEKYRKLLN